MNTASETMEHHPAHEHTAAKWVAGGSAMEAIGAIAIIALSIVGLAGILSSLMASIATIIVGAAILIEGGSFAAGTMSRSGGEETRTSQTGALGSNFLGGVGGIVLGILALLGVASVTLVSVAMIVFGATFLLSSAETAQAAEVEGSGNVLVGLGAIVLGILAVVGLVPLTLVLVSLLALGAAALFNGSAHGAKSVSVWQRS